MDIDTSQNVHIAGTSSKFKKGVMSNHQGDVDVRPTLPTIHRSWATEPLQLTTSVSPEEKSVPTDLLSLNSTRASDRLSSLTSSESSISVASFGDVSESDGKDSNDDILCSNSAPGAVDDITPIDKENNISNKLIMNENHSNSNEMTENQSSVERTTSASDRPRGRGRPPRIKKSMQSIILDDNTPGPSMNTRSKNYNASAKKTQETSIQDQPQAVQVDLLNGQTAYLKGVIDTTLLRSASESTITSMNKFTVPPTNDAKDILTNPHLSDLHALGLDVDDSFDFHGDDTFLKILGPTISQSETIDDNDIFAKKRKSFEVDSNQSQKRKVNLSKDSLSREQTLMNFHAAPLSAPVQMSGSLSGADSMMYNPIGLASHSLDESFANVFRDQSCDWEEYGPINPTTSDTFLPSYFSPHRGIHDQDLSIFPASTFHLSSTTGNDGQLNYHMFDQWNDMMDDLHVFPSKETKEKVSKSSPKSSNQSSKSSKSSKSLKIEPKNATLQEHNSQTQVLSRSSSDPNSQATSSLPRNDYLSSLQHPYNFPHMSILLHGHASESNLLDLSYCNQFTRSPLDGRFSHQQSKPEILESSDHAPLNSFYNPIISSASESFVDMSTLLRPPSDFVGSRISESYENMRNSLGGSLAPQSVPSRMQSIIDRSVNNNDVSFFGASTAGHLDATRKPVGDSSIEKGIPSSYVEQNESVGTIEKKSSSDLVSSFTTSDSKKDFGNNDMKASNGSPHPINGLVSTTTSDILSFSQIKRPPNSLSPSNPSIVQICSISTNPSIQSQRRFPSFDGLLPNSQQTALRGRYRCGRCGLPKVNHRCTVNAIVVQNATQTSKPILNEATKQPMEGERFLGLSLKSSIPISEREGSVGDLSMGSVASIHGQHFYFEKSLKTSSSSRHFYHTPLSFRPSPKPLIISNGPTVSSTNDQLKSSTMPALPPESNKSIRLSNGLEPFSSVVGSVSGSVSSVSSSLSVAPSVSQSFSGMTINSDNISNNSDRIINDSILESTNGSIAV